jgi:hypothetical protein
MKNSFARRHAIVAVSLLGAGFGTAAFAGNRHYPPFGFHVTPTIESWRSCTSMICIDAPPSVPQGDDGSGGWGWDNSINAPVTSLKVGQSATFTVTLLQPDSLPFCSDSTGSITLTYSSQDFSLSPISGAGVTFTNPFSQERSIAVFSYSGDFFCHSAQSDGFTFTPLNPTNTALITATIKVDGFIDGQAFGTFPVAIVAGKHK